MPIPQIANLLKLQELDLRLRDLETRLETLPKEMNNILKKRDEFLASTAAAVAGVKKIRARIKAEEDTVAALNADSDKLRKQSALVKKNTEYQAMLAAIELNKKKAGDAEERILLAMDELEEAKKKGIALKAVNDAEIKNLRTEFDELFNFSKVVKEEIAKLKTARPELAGKVAPEFLSPYEALLHGRSKDAPLTTAEGEICGHCHLRITAQTAIAIKKGELAFCDNCQFMLYDPEA